MNQICDEPDVTAQALLALSPENMLQEVENWTDERFELELCSWEFWARAGQLPPPSSWRLWLVLAGRGFGKTRMGAEWVRARAEEDGAVRIALIGATIAEVRQVMVEGESGLLSLPGSAHLLWEPSLRQLTWPNGAVAMLYSAARPESLRGAQHHFAWADEIAKWTKGIAAWDNLMLGLRLGHAPRAVATTTPRPVAPAAAAPLTAPSNDPNKAVTL
jgi:phage terminase large subunit-like protein